MSPIAFRTLFLMFTLLCITSLVLSSPTPIPKKKNKDKGISAAVRDEILDTHNKYRKRHHVHALEWDDTLADFAQDYIKKCVFEHSGGKYGENLAAGYATAGDSITAWYNEHKDYDYDSGSSKDDSKETGHFTQVAWKHTTRVGCAWSTEQDCPQGYGSFLVCEYDPRGNVAGEYTENVLPK